MNLPGIITNVLSLQELKKIAYDRWYIASQSQNKRVLEIGCVNHSIDGIRGQRKLGTWLFDYLHQYAAHATGIDIDKKAVSYLKKRKYDIRFGDAQNFNLKEKYDVIVASKLIDHLLNIDGFLSSCERHLNPKGKIIIADDNILCLPQLILWYFKNNLGKPDEDITVKFVPEYFRLFVKRYGLKVASIYYTVGTGNSKTLNLFRLLEKMLPKWLIYPPLFYPYYIIELEHR